MINQNMYGQPAPWGGLPQPQQQGLGGPEWQAAQQAPWRLSPWQTQGMPSGAGLPPPPQPSDMIPGFQGSPSTLPPLQVETQTQPMQQWMPQQQQQMPRRNWQPQNQMPEIMDPRTYYSMPTGDADYSTYLGNTFASAQPSTYNRIRMQRLADRLPPGFF